MGDLELQVFADRLKEYRMQHGITQKDFADKIGITAAALSAYEKNSKNPSISVVRRIADEFHISIDWLCGLTTEMNINGQINTYADLIRLIVKVVNTDLGHARWEVIFEDEETPSLSTYIPAYGILRTYDDQICNFFREWHKMYKLCCDGTIDSHLYSLWLNDKIQKYENIKLPASLSDFSDIDSDPDCKE